MGSYLEAYGSHEALRAKRARAIKLGTAGVLLAALLGLVLFFTFRNFREENQVKTFLQLLRDQMELVARVVRRHHLLLARHQLGGAKLPSSLAGARQALEEAPCGQGYGRFVLGELCHRLGDWAAAREYLEEFIGRVDEGRVALRVGLGAELERARSLLASLPAEASATLSDRRSG